MAQTASGLAAAFPLALPQGHPLTVQLAAAEAVAGGSDRLQGLLAAASGPACASLAAPCTSWPMVHLNLQPGHIVHCAYINRQSSPARLITCVSDETLHLKCLVTPLPALGGGQQAVMAATYQVFTTDAFKHPGFVEFNSTNNMALTYGKEVAAGSGGAYRYKVWELDGFSEVVSIKDTAVVDVKFTHGALVVTYSGTQVADMVLEDGAVRVPMPASHLKPQRRRLGGTTAAAGSGAAGGGGNISGSGSGGQTSTSSSSSSSDPDAPPSEAEVELDDDQHRLVTAVNTQMAQVGQAMLSGVQPPSAMPDLPPGQQQAQAQQQQQRAPIATAPAGGRTGATSSSSSAFSPSPILPRYLSGEPLVHPTSDLYRGLRASGASGSLIGVRLFSLRTGTLSASLTIAIVPGATIQLLEVFCGLLLLKQAGRPLRLIDVSTGCHVGCLSGSAFPTPYAQVFMYGSQQFLAVHPNCLELRGADGRVASRMTGTSAVSVYSALVGCNQTGTNMHLTLDEGRLLMLGSRAGNCAQPSSSSNHSSVLLYRLGRGATSAPCDELDLTSQAAAEAPQSLRELLAPLRQVQTAWGSGGDVSSGGVLSSPTNSGPLGRMAGLLAPLLSPPRHSSLQHSQQQPSTAGTGAARQLSSSSSRSGGANPWMPLPSPAAGAGASSGASAGGGSSAGRTFAPATFPPAPATPLPPTTTIKYDEASGHVLTADAAGWVHVWVEPPSPTPIHPNPHLHQQQGRGRSSSRSSGPRVFTFAHMQGEESTEEEGTDRASTARGVAPPATSSAAAVTHQSDPAPQPLSTHQLYEQPGQSSYGALSEGMELDL